MVRTVTEGGERNRKGYYNSKLSTALFKTPFHKKVSVISNTSFTIDCYLNVTFQLLPIKTETFHLQV